MGGTSRGAPCVDVPGAAGGDRRQSSAVTDAEDLGGFENAPSLNPSARGGLFTHTSLGAPSVGRTMPLVHVGGITVVVLRWLRARKPFAFWALFQTHPAAFVGAGGAGADADHAAASAQGSSEHREYGCPQCSLPGLARAVLSQGGVRAPSLRRVFWSGTHEEASVGSGWPAPRVWGGASGVLVATPDLKRRGARAGGCGGRGWQRRRAPPHG